LLPPDHMNVMCNGYTTTVYSNDVKLISKAQKLEVWDLVLHGNQECTVTKVHANSGQVNVICPNADSATLYSSAVKFISKGKAYKCSIGNSGTACKTCRSLLTGDDQCASCNRNHGLDGTVCKAYTCTLGYSGAACRTCQFPLTGNDQCASCNTGYFLDGTVCKKLIPYEQRNQKYAVCDETVRIAADCGGCGPRWGQKNDCKTLCDQYRECAYYTYFSDGRCRIYSSCKTTWNQYFSGGNVKSTIYEKQKPAVSDGGRRLLQV